MSKTRTQCDPTVLDISGLPSEIEKDYIEHHFSKKCGGKEVKVLSISREGDTATAVVSIKQLNSKGIDSANS